MPERQNIRILIADDHPMTRAGIRFFLEASPQFAVVGEATNGDEAVEMCLSLRPDVVLMDVQMPIKDGIEAARSIKSTQPEIQIIMLTSFNTEKEIFAALSAGANGYCLKDIGDDRLLIAIRAVVNGDLCLDAAIAGKLLGLLKSGEKQTAVKKEVENHGLSEREFDVLRLIVEGKTNNEIAAALFISPDTAKSHLKSIMDKLAVSDRTQAAVKAVREGLI